MITILSGGTGTPKLIQGIKEIYPEEEISVIVNTVENLYMSRGYIAADIDTVMYTFAEIIDDEFWYGIKGDTFIVREQLIEMGTTELLKLGDKDRRKILEKNYCPNCNHEMSLVISEKTPCPKCGSSLKEEF